MYSVRLLVSLIYFWSLLFPINSWSHNVETQNLLSVSIQDNYNLDEHISLQRNPANKIENQISSQELEFIMAYKGYVNAILHIQATETRKKLICLGQDYATILAKQGIVPRANILTPEILQNFNEYKNSEECKRFQETEVQDMVRSYSEMKAYLGLFQSHKFMTFLSFPPEPMRGVNSVFLHCDRLENPLLFKDSQFCFEDLLVLLNPRPDHILRSVSIPSLDKVLGWALKKQKVPKVLKLDPMIWPEVLWATERFDSYYSQNDKNLDHRNFEENYDLDQSVRDNLSQPQRKHEDYIVNNQRSERLSQQHVENYYWASQLQAQGTYVFSDYPENSAPKKYVEILTKHPVLAFYKPPLTKAKLDCRSAQVQNLNVYNLCRAYKDSYSRQLSEHYGLIHGEEVLAYNTQRSAIYAQLIKAYEKVLELNLAFINSLNLKYDSQAIFVETSQLNLKPVVLDINNWSELIGMDVALNNFLESFSEYRGLETYFVKRHGRSELIHLGLQIGVAVGLGVACGLWPLVACLLAAGAGVNLYFYNDSLNRHNDMLVKYFSTSTYETTDGLKLGLVDFEKMKSEVQGLYLDTLLIGFGIGSFQIYRAARESIRGKHLGRLAQ